RGENIGPWKASRSRSPASRSPPTANGLSRAARTGPGASGICRTDPFLRSDSSLPKRNSLPRRAGRAGPPNQTNRGRTVMRTNKTRLGVERLDEREVPACIVTHPIADTVVITGDGANDTVIIRDNGIGGVSGWATGAGAFGFTGIKNIRVFTN